MRILRFSGTEREMGLSFGETSRAEIHDLYRRRIDNAIAQAKRYGGQVVDEGDVLAVAQASVAVTRAFDPHGMDELEGIAAAADLALVKVLAMNGLTDFRDALSWPGNAAASADVGGCTAIVAAPDATRTDAAPEAGHVLAAQSWDLATDNLPFVIGVVRRPKDRPATCTLTTDGCLSLIGMNEHGLAIGTTNIRTTDARPGVNYLSVIHKALAQTTHEAAAEVIARAPRAGAHFYYVASAERVTLLECSARNAIRRELERGVAVHANHCLEPENQAIEGSAATSSSRHRQARMEALGAERPLTFEKIRGFFADTDGGADAICRDDFDGLNTNGAVVMAPGTRRIELVHGVPSRGTWVALGF